MKAHPSRGLLVGVDGGGTTTRVLALDPITGNRSSGAAEGANWTVHGPGVCAAHIRAAVEEATGDAPIAQLALCIAGYYPPDHAATAAAWAAQVWPGVPVRIEPDYLAAWYGAHGGEPGLVVIAGTGSIAYGRAAPGKEARAGGWGPLYGDDGSAYWIGVEFLRWLALLEDSGQPEDATTRRIRQHHAELGSDRRSWLRGVYRVGWGREEVARLGGEVGAGADSGHPLMADMVREGAARLVTLSGHVARRLWSPSPSASHPVSLQGGLASSCTTFHHGFRSEVERTQSDPMGRRLRVVMPAHPPVEGAVLLAAAAAGYDDLAPVRAVLA